MQEMDELTELRTTQELQDEPVLDLEKEAFGFSILSLSDEHYLK